ncbi:hypothetical protein ACFYQA_01615 [Streptomyces sp. NPDC005774]|uniref:hypothetical protein n=1 Tax=Streptomyces sp. NPDC005774 TaxID=3364728 RepID=UPI0036B5BB32
MTAREEGGVHIGDVHRSTFAIGENAHAESHHGVPAPGDAAGAELLAAVKELRADLARLRPGEQTAQLDEALAETEEEIDRTGTAGESRRRRLRDLLAGAETLTALLASAATVAGLLGM